MKKRFSGPQIVAKLRQADVLIGQGKADAKKYIEIFKPGGGYVFNNVHNIQGGVPAKNIVALMDAAYEYGFYGD